MRVGETKGYFLSSQSGQGYYSFLKNSVHNLQKKIVLRGGTNQLRSRIMRNISFSLVDRGFNMEAVYGTINPINLEAVIMPQLDLCILGTEGLDISKVNASKTIDIGEYCFRDYYLVYKSKIKDLEEQARVSLELAQEELCGLKNILSSNSGKIDQKDELQALYITEKLLRKLFSLDQGKIVNRFAQCITGKGVIDCYSSLLTKIKNRHYLNGIDIVNGGWILKLVAREAVTKGLSVEVYHNCLEPALIELLIIPDLNLAIGIRDFSGDFQKLISYKQGEKEITNKTIYDLDLDKGIKFLEQVDELNDEVCILFNETIDFHEIEKLEKKLLTEIIEDIR